MTRWQSVVAGRGLHHHGRTFQHPGMQAARTPVMVMVRGYGSLARLGRLGFGFAAACQPHEAQCKQAEPN